MDNEKLQVHPALAQEWFDETKIPVQQEEVPQEVAKNADPIVEEPIQEQQPEPEQLEQEPQNSVKENMRMLREKAKRAERERDELYNMLKQQMERQQYQQPQPKPQAIDEDDEDYEYRDDSIVEGKDLRKLKKEIKALRKEVSRSTKESEQQAMAIAIEAKIRATYPDFDKIVNRDSIEMLNSTDPILANTLSKSPDLFDKAISTYNVIKKYNLHKIDDYQDTIKLKENKSKPRALASITAQQHQTSPLSRMNAFAGDMTEELRNALIKDMEDSIAKKHLR